MKQEDEHKIRIDKEHYTVEQDRLTGAELLGLAGKTPSRFQLIQRFPGGRAEPIAPDQVVSVCEPGVERFVTLPLDQTEGGDET